MDADILRAILNSYGSIENVQCEDYKSISKETILCPHSETILNTLCASLSNLLYHKVSKKAYQRYSVRLLVIDILRKWCRMTSSFEHLQIFTSTENSLKFVTNLLNKYVTDDILNSCYSNDSLISLTTAVIYLSMENPSFMHHVDRLLVRLSQLETNENIEKFLHNTLRTNLHLRLSTREEIYILHRSKLIEEPLLKSLMCTLPDANTKNCMNNHCEEEALNRLLELSVESTRVFQSMFSFLKQLLVQLRYAPAVLNFIDSLLKRISVYCEYQGKDILDLYPRKLHSCLILLRIKPEHHTLQTREYTLQTMNRIFAENKNVMIILISHFPEWLEFFATYITDNALS